jgi:hypothetical protein
VKPVNPELARHGTKAERSRGESKLPLPKREPMTLSRSLIRHRAKTMGIVRRLSWFGHWAASNKFWSLGGAAFLSILWFIVSVGGQLPEQFEKFQADSMKFQMYLLDLEKMKALMGYTYQAVFGFLVPVQLYNDRAVTGSLTPDEISKGLKAATEARIHIAAAAGLVQGTTFTDSRFQSFKDSLQKDIEQLGNMATTVQEVFVLVDVGKKEEATAKINEFNSSPKIIEIMTAASTRLRDSNLNIPFIGREYVNNIYGKIWEARKFLIMLLAAIAGLCYEVAFVVVSTILFWRWRGVTGSMPPDYSENQSRRARVGHRSVRRSNRSPQSKTARPWRRRDRRTSDHDHRH